MPPKSREEEEEERGGVGFGLMGGLLVGAVVAAVAFFAGSALSSQPKEEEAYVVTAETKARMARKSADENGGASHASGETDVPEGSACVYCLSAPREMMFNACGHVCLCEQCAYTAAGGSQTRVGSALVFQCPLCRQMSSLRRVYC